MTTAISDINLTSNINLHLLTIHKFTITNKMKKLNDIDRMEKASYKEILLFNTKKKTPISNKTKQN